MSSVTSSVASPALGKKFFVAISATTQLDATGTTNSAAVVAGVAVVGLGLKVVIPNPASGSATTKVLRKVKLLNRQTASAAYDTFYIDVTGPTSAWASLSL